MLIMTPGPIAVDERVIAAMNRPAVPHYFPDYFDVFDETLAILKKVYGTSGDAIILPGSGRVGLEAAICSATDRGDKVLCIVNGTFSRWAVEISRRAGCQPDIIESRFGGPVDLDAVKRAIEGGGYRLVSIVHSETSTGAENPIGEVGEMCKQSPALFMVDAISSLGSMYVNMDEMGIDLCVAGSQKGLGSITGLSIVGVSEKAYDAMNKKKTPCQSYALDIKRWRDQFFGAEGARPYPVIPSTHLVFALHEACRLLDEEGLHARLDRHKMYAEATRRAVEAMGLTIFPDRDIACDSLTAVCVPDGLSDKDIVRDMREDYGVVISGGIFELKGKVFRISHMGVQASIEYLAPSLAALEKVLTKLGYKAQPGVGVSEFLRNVQ